MAAIPAATRKPQRELPLQESRALMRDHFTEHTGEKYNEGWAKLWEAGDFLPWDRMMPSPALPDTLDNHASVVGSAKLVLPDGTTRRKRALVPGCGRGVDVMLLQAYGYDVVGLEYSSKAVEACEVYAKETENEALYRIKDEKASKGSRVFVQGDFYADDWLEKAGLGEHGKEGVFELIYDYTFFCAMQPSMRPAWAKRMSTLLAPNPQANLICLEFPTTKAPNAGGPPFASPSKAYMEHLSHPGEDIPYSEEGEVRMQPFAESGPGALERVGHWQPADTHGIGKDADGNVADYISVWRHR
ncbi:hypothetical protein PMZ80_005051 [Knufia obscura]|uniref:Thiol methyltransferase n=2 Tax=Knufia TaxID=430999 RepID=A0AAN8ES75_9EURO|nr:hypothetical protein PMZ80_005051 [Knufia obscura]KAK5957713.1 hypothetical protein OHC33_000902 [Knufia fluminis]